MCPPHPPVHPSVDNIITHWYKPINCHIIIPYRGSNETFFLFNGDTISNNVVYNYYIFTIRLIVPIRYYYYAIVYTSIFVVYTAHQSYIIIIVLDFLFFGNNFFICSLNSFLLYQYTYLL